MNISAITKLIEENKTAILETEHLQLRYGAQLSLLQAAAAMGDGIEASKQREIAVALHEAILDQLCILASLRAKIQRAI